jgi:hypothetical protein
MNNRFRLKHKLIGMFLIAILLIGLFNPLSVKPAQAACTWGDIICDMQQAMQQLADQYVTPLKAWVQLQANKAAYTLEYDLSLTVAAFMWAQSKMLITVGVGIGILNEWLAQSFFQPMIQVTNTSMKPIFGVFLFAAFCILGLSYFLAAFIHLNVVSLRSIVVWWFAGALFFSIGPSFYLSMRDLHQSLSSLFYSSSLTAFGTQNPFQNLALGDPAASNPIYEMPTLCSNFSTYLIGSAGNINGLDISLAFQKADGFDVVAGGAKCLGGGMALDLPRRWFDQNGFFDLALAPEGWPAMVTCPTDGTACDYDGLVQIEVTKMQTAVNQTFVGTIREWQSIPLAWFAIVEQFVALCLIIAQGLTFVSFSCATIFAFFRRTEPIALAIIDQWLSLLVQSVVIALVQGMTMALYLAAASVGSPLVTMAVSLVALIMMIILFVSGLKAVWSSFNRLFEAFGQASGGVFLSPGQVGASVVNTAVGSGGAVLSGGLSLASGALSATGSAIGGAELMNRGATLGQSAGVMFGGSKALDGAAFQLARLPGLSNTPLGEAANQYVEGAATRRIGNTALGAIPGVGGALSRLGGAALGAALLTDRSPSPYAGDSASSDNQAAPAGQTGASGAKPTLTGGGATKPLALNDGNLEKKLDQDIKRDLQADRQDKQGGASAGDERLSQAAQKLDDASSALKASADGLQQAAQSSASSTTKAKDLEPVEGQLNVSGANNMAAIMGRTIDTLQQQNQATGQQGATSDRVGKAMAGAMGMTPVEQDGQPIAPIEGRTNRYQMFADQALRSGLSGSDAAQMLREVKTSPDGQLQPETRDRLVQAQHDEHGQSWASGAQNVQWLEQMASLVPNTVTAYGTRNVPSGSGNNPIVLSPANGNGGGPVVFTPAQTPMAAPVAQSPSTTPTQSPSASPALSGSEDNYARPTQADDDDDQAVPESTKNGSEDTKETL